jgi:hypothetical protein
VVLAERLEMCIKLADTVFVGLVSQFRHTLRKLLRVLSTEEWKERPDTASRR